jgi:phosphoribosylformylglycinamidine synthase
LFNESQSRILISVASENLEKTISRMSERDVPFQQLGKVGGEELHIRIDEQTFRWRVTEIYDEWWNAIRRAVEKDESIPSL